MRLKRSPKAGINARYQHRMIETVPIGAAVRPGALSRSRGIEKRQSGLSVISTESGSSRLIHME